MQNYYYKQVQFGPGGITPAVRTILAANIAVFILTSIAGLVDRFSGSDILSFIILRLGISPKLCLGGLHIWQPLTYMFLHSGLFHIFFNMLMLWMFGVEVERRMGTRVFVIFYFFCGLGAGLFSLAFNSGMFAIGQSLSMTVPASLWSAPTIGASGAIFGVMLAFGLLFPDRMILLFFVFPVPALYFVIGLCFFELYYLIFMHGGGISYAAHVGGMLFGFLFLRNPAGITRAVGGAAGKLVKPAERDDYYDAASAQKKVDAILDKINREGIHRLTRAERAFLREHIRRQKH